jgi:hypothetical protein
MEKTWSWIKEKTAEAVVNTVVLGMVMLIGYGILQAFIGDSKLEKTVATLRKEIVDTHNDTIKREGELLAKLAALQEQVDRMAKPSGPPNPSELPPILFNQMVPTAPSMAPNPAQQQLDFMTRNQKRYKD